MPELHTVLSPVFPADKDLDINDDTEPLAQTSSVQIFVQLAEPVVFLQGFEIPQTSETQPSLLRGSLIVRVLKQSKLKNISLTFKGSSRTEWPEGIPPKKSEFVEVNDIVNHTWPFYQADNKIHNSHASSSSSRRNSVSSTSTENDLNLQLLKESGASIYKPLVRHKHSGSINALSSLSLSSPSFNDNVNENSTANGGRSLSPISILRRAATPGPKHEDHRTHRSGTATSLISDILGGSFSSTNESASPNTNGKSNGSGSNNHTNSHGYSLNENSNNNISANTITSGSGNEHFAFPPGDYIYSFEQVIPASYPETIKADFGFVEYQLLVSVERYGTFKSNIAARFPVTIVRTQSDTSIEETEPIAISRDWEDQLHYDIVIASKDIILDAFLPISFSFSPLDKVTLHRIRIYLTESLEYYCRNNKVHRMETTRKFLLAEHCGKRLPGVPENQPLKAKNMSNLLLDESNGDLVNKDYDYQVFVPSVVNNHQHLHPDTGFDKIKANHWIKLCLRLSRVVDGKRKHYEISIDSPIHVLHKLCSHANTLLPSYDSHLMINESAMSNMPEFGNISNVSIYHSSNFFFPKEILQSPVLSPEVHALDAKIGSSHSRNLSPRPIRNQGRKESHSSDDPAVMSSPKFRSNIYQPENIQRELTSPQAVPLSPIVSPLIRPVATLDAPPEFDFDSPSDPPAIFLQRDMPSEPPTYHEVMKEDGVDSNSIVPRATKTNIPKLMLSKSDESLVKPHSQSIHTMLRSRSKNDSKTKDEEGDITSGFSFQGVSKVSPNLPSAVLKLPPSNGMNLSPDVRRDRTGSFSGVLPSTIRNGSTSYNDMSSILFGDGKDNDEAEGEMLNKVNTERSDTSSFARSARSSIDSTERFSGSYNMQPLLHRETNQNYNPDDSIYQSRDSINNYSEEPLGASVDITALYDRNANGWHPLQDNGTGPLSPVSSPGYSANVANSNHVLDDFRKAFGGPERSLRESSSSTLRANDHAFTRQNSATIDNTNRDAPTLPGEKQLFKETDRETSLHSINGGMN
ncbi:hypothetical protein HG535_0H01160 [Zygotorulaspora mrakii]|uniref:Arrestin C-terminal-like domain-containing protein n=1 Tax=Zygotorulaspora mrakii TaxID=42260 RepID=A0A7H9B9V6_ZYGMR|nr:uncharacterized protein HG535_0H01160 [Zygotorulaspora mrakii]QLG74789.1 hypothetical protein HG535_0H01160 [Zygotorulaspora mrakii]